MNPRRTGTAQRPLPVGSTVTGASPRRWGAVLAVLVVGVTGCSDGGSGPTPSAAGTGPTVAAADVGLTATLVAHRDDVLRRIVSVQLRAAQPVEVLQVRLETPAFRAAPPGTAVPGTEADLLPGSPVDLRVPYGPADCTDRTDRAATAVVQVALGGGQSEVRLPVASAPEVLGRLQRAECAELDARRQVELTLDGFAGRQAPPGQEVITGTLRVRRLAGTTAVLHGVPGVPGPGRRPAGARPGRAARRRPRRAGRPRRRGVRRRGGLRHRSRQPAGSLSSISHAWSSRCQANRRTA